MPSKRSSIVPCTRQYSGTVPVAGTMRAALMIVPPIVPAGWIGKLVSAASESHVAAGAMPFITVSVATSSFFAKSCSVLAPDVRPETVPVSAPLASGWSEEVTSLPFSRSVMRSACLPLGPVTLTGSVVPVTYPVSVNPGLVRMYASSACTPPAPVASNTAAIVALIFMVLPPMVALAHRHVGIRVALRRVGKSVGVERVQRLLLVLGDKLVAHRLLVLQVAAANPVRCNLGIAAFEDRRLGIQAHRPAAERGVRAEDRIRRRAGLNPVHH